MRRRMRNMRRRMRPETPLASSRWWLWWGLLTEPSLVLVGGGVSFVSDVVLFLVLGGGPPFDIVDVFVVLVLIGVGGDNREG